MFVRKYDTLLWNYKNKLATFSDLWIIISLKLNTYRENNNNLRMKLKLD